MNVQNIIDAARRYASKMLPRTAGGSAHMASLLGSGLRVLDRATHNGRMLRMTGNHRLEQLAEGLTGTASALLRQKGTAAILRKAPDKVAANYLRTMIKSLIVPEAYGNAVWYNRDFRRLHNRLSNQVKSLHAVNPDSISKRMLHKARANYTDVLRGVQHGAPADAYAGADMEVRSVLNSRKGANDHMNDLLELTIPKDVPGVGGQKVQLTGRNLNGATYLEEAAATPEQRRVLAQVIGRSNVPIGTTVMADIGEAMQRYPGMHVVAQSTGGWFDPSGVKVEVPKLILVNDAALKAGRVEDIIAQHRELYNPQFIKRTKFMDHAALASIRENKRGFTAWNNLAKSLMPDSDRQTLDEFKGASDRYMQAASTGFLPVGFVKDNAALRSMRRQLAETRRQLEQADAAGDQGMVGRLKAQLDELNGRYGELEAAARVTEPNKVRASTADLDVLARRARQASTRAGGTKRLFNDIALVGDVEGAATQLRPDASPEAVQQFVDTRLNIPEYKPWDDSTAGQAMLKFDPSTMTKRGFMKSAANADALKKTLKNAWHLYRTSPGKALKKTIEYGVVQGPLATASQLFNPKTLVSNRALGTRYMRTTGYDSAAKARDIIRHDRTAQAIMAAGLTAAGLGTYALAGRRVGSSQTVPKALATTPAPAAQSTEPSDSTVMQEPGSQAAPVTGRFQQALDWAKGHTTELGAGAALTAAVLGGAWLANRKKRRKAKPGIYMR